MVVDNLNIHTGAALYELLEQLMQEKFLKKIEFHYTPKHGSWLNMGRN